MSISHAAPHSTTPPPHSSSSRYDMPPPGAPDLPPAFYARIAPVPLLLSPALHLPAPIQLPDDLHPLPLDLAPYIIYPFSLEHHVLHPHPANGGPLVEEDPRDILHAAHEYLAERAAHAERERKAALQRIAPGWAELEGRAGVLEPTKRAHPPPPPSQPSSTSKDRGDDDDEDLDNLAAQMASLHAATLANPSSRSSTSSTTSTSTATGPSPPSSLIPAPPAPTTISSAQPASIPSFHPGTAGPSAA